MMHIASSDTTTRLESRQLSAPVNHSTKLAISHWRPGPHLWKGGCAIETLLPQDLPASHTERSSRISQVCLATDLTLPSPTCRLAPQIRRAIRGLRTGRFWATKSDFVCGLKLDR
jgi:hypothetical protein